MSENSRRDPCEEFDELFEQVHGVTFAWLLGQTGNREQAADLLQEVFVRVWRHIDDIAGCLEGERRAWVSRIARNVLVDMRRRERVRSILSAPATDEEVATDQPGPDRIALAKESARDLERAIFALPEDLRTVLVLTTLQDMTSEEIGNMLSMPAGTVRTRLREARRRVSRAMGLS